MGILQKSGYAKTPQIAIFLSTAQHSSWKIQIKKLEVNKFCSVRISLLSFGFMMYIVITEKRYWTLSLKIALLEQQSHGRFNLCFKRFVITDADEFRINSCTIFFFLFGYLRTFCFSFSTFLAFCILFKQGYICFYSMQSSLINQ